MTVQNLHPRGKLARRQACAATRNGQNWTVCYRGIAEAALPNWSIVLDGEVVLLTTDGHSDFDGLHSRRHDAEIQFSTAWCSLAMISEDCRCTCAMPNGPAESVYRRGRSNRWIKVKNRSHPAFSRVMHSFE